LQPTLDNEDVAEFEDTVLAPFGLDARDPRFWEGGLSVIARLIDELETLG
jgi:oligoendopeptidase F